MATYTVFYLLHNASAYLDCSVLYINTDLYRDTLFSHLELLNKLGPMRGSRAN